MGTHLQSQAAAEAVDADVRLARANQRNSMHQRRGRVVRGPRAAENVPLKDHAVAPKIGHRNRPAGVGRRSLTLRGARHLDSRSGNPANVLSTIPAVKSCGNTTGPAAPGFEL